MPHRPPFDLKRPLVAAREFTFAGKKFEKGDPFHVEGFNPRLIRRQYEARVVNHTDEEAVPESLVQMTGPSGGRYTITAPWLEKPEVVRGKVPAQERLAEITEEGPPEGWTPEAPKEPELRPLEGNDQYVIVTVGENDVHTVNTAWLDEPEDFPTAEDAAARQAELRAEGPPEGWEPPAPPAE